MVYVNVSYDFLYYYASKRSLNTLAVLLKLRSLHTNSTFYNFSMKSLSKKSGLNHQFLKAHLATLRQDGWVREVNGHMTLVKASKLKERYSFDLLRNVEVRIDNKTSWREIVDELKLILLQSKANRSYYSFKHRDTDVTSGGDTLESIRAMYYNEIGVGQNIISYKGLAELWGCSPVTAVSVIKRMVDKGVLLKKRNVVDTGFDSSFISELQELHSSFFVKNGVVYKQMANTYAWN